MKTAPGLLHRLKLAAPGHRPLILVSLVVILDSSPGLARKVVPLQQKPGMENRVLVQRSVKPGHRPRHPAGYRIIPDSKPGLVAFLVNKPGRAFRVLYRVPVFLAGTLELDHVIPRVR